MDPGKLFTMEGLGYRVDRETVVCGARMNQPNLKDIDESQYPNPKVKFQ